MRPPAHQFLLTLLACAPPALADNTIPPAPDSDLATSDPSCPPRTRLAEIARTVLAPEQLRPTILDGEDTTESYITCMPGRFPMPGFAVAVRAECHGVRFVIDTTGKVRAAGPIEGYNCSAPGATRALRTVDLDRDGTDEIIEEHFYDSQGFDTRTLDVLRLRGPHLVRAFSLPLAEDNQGHAGYIVDAADDDMPELTGAALQKAIAAAPHVVVHEARWEIVPAAGSTPPRIRVVAKREPIFGRAPDLTPRERRRIVRNCALFEMRGAKFVRRSCPPR